MNKSQKLLLLVFIAVFTCNTPTFATTSFFTDLDKPTKEAYFFFPYNKVAILTIKSASKEKENENYVFNLTAIVNENLRGNFKKNKPVKFSTYSDLSKIFDVKNVAELKGTQQLLAFNCHTEESLVFKGREFPIHIEDVFVPFGNKYKESNLNIFRANLKKILPPFRSCLIVDIKKAKQYKEYDSTHFDLDLLVKDVVLEDKIYPAAKPYFEHRKKVSDGHGNYSLPFNLEARQGQTLKVHFANKKRKDILYTKPPYGTYVLRWNPEKDWGNKYQAVCQERDGSDIFQIIPLAQFDQKELIKIKKSPTVIAAQMESLRKQIEAYLKERWTLDRIKAYTSHPENRDAIPFIHTKNSISMRGCRIGGLLYPEHEKEIGKIEWRTSIKNNDLYGQYSIFAYSDKNCVIAITSDQAFDKHIPSKEEFEKQLLGDILVFSCRGYWGVLREEYNKTPDKSRFEWCHEAPTGEIDIKRDSDGKPTSFSCKMKSFSIPPKDLILTADTNENFDITNVKINGEVNLGWKELLENRVHYSDKMWQLLDEWKAKRENAEKESQKK